MSKENPAMVMLEALTPAVKSMHRAILPLNKAMTEQREKPGVWCWLVGKDGAMA